MFTGYLVAWLYSGGFSSSSSMVISKSDVSSSTECVVEVDIGKKIFTELTVLVEDWNQF